MFDAHAHYHDKAFDDDREKVLKSLKRSGITLIYEAGEDIAGSISALEMAESYRGDEYPVIKVSAGIHPLYIKECPEAQLECLRKLSKEKILTAIGECGLDYRDIKDETVRSRQREVFEGQLALCEELGLPAVVHSVGAAEDTLKLLKAHPEIRGLMHGFAYSAEVAQQCVKLGWKIGINAVITRPDAVKIKKVAAVLPAESILVETDAPYMLPYGRKDRNDSRSLYEIRDAINRIREEAGAEKICQKQES